MKNRSDFSCEVPKVVQVIIQTECNVRVISIHFQINFIIWWRYTQTWWEKLHRCTIVWSLVWRKSKLSHKVEFLSSQFELQVHKFVTRVWVEVVTRVHDDVRGTWGSEMINQPTSVSLFLLYRVWGALHPVCVIKLSPVYFLFINVNNLKLCLFLCIY